jgi:hypothetical protein
MVWKEEKIGNRIKSSPLAFFFDTQPEEGDSSLLSWLWAGAGE